MAIQTGGIFGRLLNSINGLNYTTWQGRQVVRRNPAGYNDKNSVDQQKVRQRLQAKNILSNILKLTLSKTLPPPRPTITWRNYFMTLNKDRTATTLEGLLLRDAEKIKFTLSYQAFPFRMTAEEELNQVLLWLDPKSPKPPSPNDYRFDFYKFNFEGNNISSESMFLELLYTEIPQEIWDVSVKTFYILFCYKLDGTRRTDFLPFIYVTPEEV
jgi:hypothetical protein